MHFIDRAEELRRLESLAATREGGLAVVYGRRRIGKTRLLLEWVRRRNGAYTVADLSAAEVQRRYLATALAGRLPGFDDVEYRDWPTFLSRLAREARGRSWRGPIVFDEFPYLVLASPALPSMVQRWVDHDARAARLVVALAGSSQRMMQGLVLAADAPLYGRARVVLDVGPLAPACLPDALGHLRPGELVASYAAWGGVPRYWELAAELSGSTRRRIERLVLDPLGPLHREPDRLLIEETPSALEVRPVLDAIGSGAHRVSEMAGRLGRPATSLSRPLERLVGMGLVRREVPFGESERRSKKSLYFIDDPFFRLWFRVVASHRAALASGSPRTRGELLDRYYPGLLAAAWEELCRKRVPHLDARHGALGRLGPWGPAGRWWSGTLPEWDVVSATANGRRLLLGEAKWARRPLTADQLEHAWRALSARPAPVLGERHAGASIVRALFVPDVARGARMAGGVLVTAADLLRR
jgi:hypothetical protein